MKKLKIINNEKKYHFYKILIEELMMKIDEQKKELELRSNNLMAIQRNFESLSMMCKNEKQTNNELKAENLELRSDHTKLIELSHKYQTR